MPDQYEMSSKRIEQKSKMLKTEGLKYIREFDSLRAIAVLSVMFSHYFAQLRISETLGSCGVTLFFVLSGYLITQILLKGKQAYGLGIGKNSQGVFSVLKVFYIRRLLRIFPIYYLTLIVLVLLNFETAREYIGYHIFYLSNFLYSFKIGFDHLSHFWSLAVEEQFYLVWPFIILLLPPKFMNVLFFAFLIAGSVFFKFIMAIKYSFNSYAIDLLMPSCIESFAAGALTVLLKGKIKNHKLLIFLLGSSFLLFFLNQYLVLSSQSFIFAPVCKILSRTIFSLFSGLLLICVTDRVFSGIVLKGLNNKYLVFLGKMSYGVYIYHMFVPAILIYLQSTFRFSLAGTGFYLLSGFILSFLIAYVSYKIIELPINNLKRKFAYK